MPRAGVRDGGVVLVRPDGFIGFRAVRADTAGQAENDYSIRPTKELAAALEPANKIVQSKIYPAFGLTPMEGHLFESRGAQLWQDDVRLFLERYL